MTRRTLITILVASWAASVPLPVAAHDGHVHTVRGTVVQVSDKQLDIRGEDGKPVTIALDAKTTVLKGTQKSDRAAVQIGQRVVVDVGNGKAPLVARSIKLAAPAAKK
jgi:hypothetical protein